MAQREAWPDMAHTTEDVYKFCQMMNPGRDSDIVDLTQSLPGNGSAESCLFQIQNSTLADLLQHIPTLGQEVFNMKMDEEQKTNSQHPEKTLQISGSKIVYYESASINRGNCQCIFTFGGEQKQDRVQVTYAAENSMPGLAIEHFFVRNFLQEPSTWYKQNGCFSTVNYCLFLFMIVYCLLLFFIQNCIHICIYIYIYRIYKYLYKYIYIYWNIC